MCACFRMWYMNCQQCASGTRKSWSSQKKLAQLCTKPLPTCYYHLQLFSQRKKFRLLPIGHMLLSFLLVFLMLECLSLCNDIWWLWQRHDNSDAVMKMLCLFATRRAVDLAEWLVVEATGQLPRPLRWCGWITGNGDDDGDDISHICHGRHEYTRVNFYLAGVNFYRFNAKNWQFTV